jgi:hypothetical protein
MAFGDARNKKLLNRELAGTTFGLDDKDAKKRLKDAVNLLTIAASGDRPKMRGKYFPADTDVPKGAKIDVIPSVALANYRQFDITIDGLRFGRGLAWLPDEKGVHAYAANELSDFYAEVTVNRSELMRTFSGGVAGLSAVKKGSLPSLSKAALEKWWNQLKPEEKALPKEVHYKMCRASHPEHSVSRRRVRDLTPNRTPGPKPIRP